MGFIYILQLLVHFYCTILTNLSLSTWKLTVSTWHETPEHNNTFPKDHLVLFALQLSPCSFKWHSLILIQKMSVNSHSAVTFFLAHNFIDIYCIPLCHLFFSLEESYSILSFLTGNLLRNSRSSPPLFPNLLLSYPLYATQALWWAYIMIQWYFIMIFSTLASSLLLITYLLLLTITECKTDTFMEHLFQSQFPKRLSPQNPLFYR